MRTRSALLLALAGGGLLAVGGCGGNSPAKTVGSSRTASARPVRAAILGESHDPTVNRPWHYTVTVTGTHGTGLSGTETTQYTFDGLVVGTEHPENVRFTGGVYHDTVEFPAAAVGHPLAVQAVVHTRVGSATTAGWPVEVHR